MFRAAEKIMGGLGAEALGLRLEGTSPAKSREETGKATAMEQRCIGRVELSAHGERVGANLAVNDKFQGGPRSGEHLGEGGAEQFVGLGRAESEIDLVAAGGELGLRWDIPRTAITVGRDGDGAAGAETLGVKLKFDERLGGERE